MDEKALDAAPSSIRRDSDECFGRLTQARKEAKDKRMRWAEGIAR
jgi:hypothetical protein